MRSGIFFTTVLSVILMLWGCGGGEGGGDADAREDAPADPASEDAAGDEVEERPDQESAPETAEEIVEVPEAADPSTEDSDVADAGGDEPPGDAAGPCDDRTGGALMTLSVCGTETMIEWIENDAFIDEAIAILGGAPPRVPNMTLADGTDCNPQWSWHVDPRAVEWADMTIELCDGCPSMVEADLAYWLGTVRSFCPWNAGVAAVDDRR